MTAQVSRRTDALWAAGVGVSGLALYVMTLAPTVTWGDDATLQLNAAHGALHASAGSHPAWVALAHMLSRLPGREPAYWINFTSALAAATALILLFLLLRELKIATASSLLAVAAFAVSHTFWSHAVRTEVYTLALATQLLVIWTALRWFAGAGDGWLVALGAALGLALSTHLLVLLFMPAVAWLLWSQRHRLSMRSLALLAASIVITLLPLLYLVVRDAASQGLTSAGAIRWALFTFDGYDFSQAMLKVNSAGLPRDVFEWLAFLVYQFVGPGVLLGLVGALWASRMLTRTLVVFVWLMYAVPTLFALTYRVGDRFVFFLPGYIAVAVWIGIGAAAVEGWLRGRGWAAGALRAAQGLALVALVIAPVLSYRLTPTVMQVSGISFRNDRLVPGPQARYFLPWPPKAGYYDARTYASDALDSAPAGAVILADPILASPMLFLQQVEGRRTDVEVRFCCWDIDQALLAAGGRPVALADNTAGIYPIASLERRFQLEPQGPLYLLR